MDQIINAAKQQVKQVTNNSNSNTNKEKYSKLQQSSRIEGIKEMADSTKYDLELEQVLKEHSARIRVVGCGGGGNNTIDRISAVGIVGAETIAINTDAQDLLYTTADKKILIGKEVTKGLGAGSNPKLGELAAQENYPEIRAALDGADMVFITCGLGGGTGSGSVAVVAETAKKVGALTIAIVTIPFTMEGSKRYENALYGLQRLAEFADTLIVIPNEKLVKLVPDMPLPIAFKIADEILTNSVKGIAELVTKAGLVNLDLADVRAVMTNGGVALIGVGEAEGEDRAVNAVDKALSNPLLDVDIDNANSALINISGSSTLTLNEAKQIVVRITSRINQDAKVIWGAQIYDDMEGTLRVTVIVTGVKSEQILGSSESDYDRKR